MKTSKTAKNMDMQKQDFYSAISNANFIDSMDYRERLRQIKQLENPLHFNCDGINVRIVHDGTADLNSLVKGLFLNG